MKKLVFLCLAVIMALLPVACAPTAPVAPLSRPPRRRQQSRPPRLRRPPPRRVC